jgi:hypothetical protein
MLIFCAHLFGVMYLAWCDFMMNPTKEEHQILSISRKKCDGDDAVIRRVFVEESMSCIRKVQTHWDRMWRDRWRAKSRACSSYSLTSRELLTKNHFGRLNSQFHILLWHFTANAWKCASTSLGTLATKELAVAARQHIVSHFLFHQGIFDQKQHDCCPHPTFLCFSHQR